MYQRSADMFLGVPFNIASYALFTHMLAQICNLEVGDLIITIGDAHIYNNHFEQVKEQLAREPLPLATLKLNPEISVITDFEMEDIELEGYTSHDAIKAPMAV
jgi:thymidylate synthase